MQTNLKSGILALAATLAIGLPLIVGAADAPAAVTPEAAQQAIADAEAARKKAADGAGEWRDTAKMIKEAEEALKAGDAATAMAKAKKAKEQGELGLTQAEANRSPDPKPFF